MGDRAKTTKRRSCPIYLISRSTTYCPAGITWLPFSAAAVESASSASGTEVARVLRSSPCARSLLLFEESRAGQWGIGQLDHTFWPSAWILGAVRAVAAATGGCGGVIPPLSLLSSPSSSTTTASSASLPS